MKTVELKNLDPRTKMVIMLSVSCSAMFLNCLCMLFLLFLFVLCILIWSGVSWKEQRKQFCAGVGMAVFVFLLQMLFGQWYQGMILALRLLIFFQSALLLLTTNLRDYLLAFVQMKMPYELAYMIILAFRFFPLLKREALDISYGMQLRGTEIEKASLREKPGLYKDMCLPILCGALQRAKDSSIAMEARGFRAFDRRSYMRRLNLSGKDIVVMILVPLFCAGMVCVSFFLSDEMFMCKSSLGMQVALSKTEKDCLTVSWSDDEAYEGILEWEDRKIPAQREEIREKSYYRYAAKVTGLTDNHTYVYTVGSEYERSKKGQYVCKEQKEFSFLYMGDVQYQLRDRDYEQWGRFLENIYQKNKNIQFCILGGDMVEKGADTKDWSSFFENGEKVFSRIPMMTVVGNHETSVKPDTYLKMMTLPKESPVGEECYSFDWGDCHIVSLNSCLFMEERECSKQILKEVQAWLAADLAHSDASWKIAVLSLIHI